MDVVVAAATPWGRSAIALVRWTGPGADRVLGQVVRPFNGEVRPDGRQRRVYLVDHGGTYDDAVAVLRRGPLTSTGEDLAEVACHGNPLIVERLLRAACAAGARIAVGGEFTRRALANGRLDLVGAEAVLQVVEATSARGLSVGRDGLDGRLHEFLQEIRAGCVAAASDLEARLDYPSDELALLDDATVVANLREVVRRCQALASTFDSGRVLVHGARVALVGAVNAGKSSLFNALLGRARALVHPSPGTTRDVLEVLCSLEGLQTLLLDTAGERETTDPVEAAGLALAQELVAETDLLVVVLRARPEGADDVERAILARTADRRRVIVVNGVDRPGVSAGPPGAVETVAITGAGVERLRSEIVRALVGQPLASEELMIASARQRDLLLAIVEAIAEAIAALPDAGAAVAADAVVRALEEIDNLSGADTREDVLDALFARFCIGK
jgi:tRNA modification GTPase